MKPPSVRTDDKWIVAGHGAETPVPATEAHEPGSWLPPDVSPPVRKQEDQHDEAAIGTSGAARDPAPSRAGALPRRARRPARVKPTTGQGFAVEAYCRELCAPDDVPAATTEALAAFSANAARLGPRATPEDHARLLSRVTRTAAAAHVRVDPAGSGWRSRVTEALTAERDVGCRGVPGLLARRQNGELPGDAAAGLRDHLRECLRCQAIEPRVARAERAFTVVSVLGVRPPGVAGVGLAATDAAEESEAAEASQLDGSVASEPSDWLPVQDDDAAPAAGAAATGALGSAATPVSVAAAEAWLPTTGPDEHRDSPPDEPATLSAPSVRRRRFAPLPVAAAVGVLAACGVGAAAVLGGTSSRPASARHAVIPATPSTSRPAAKAPAHKRTHQRHVVHHKRKPKPRRPTPAPAPANTTPTATTPTANPAITGSAGNSGAATPAPVVPSPSPAPAPSSGSSGASGGGSGGGSASSATIQQPSLGATSAPTQGIGSQH